MVEETKQGVQSLEKGIGVLVALAEAKTSLRLTELAEAVGMSRSKAHAYLTSLVRTGMASQDPDSARYSLGETALRIGVTALRRLDLFSVAREALLQLQRNTGETAFLATWTQQGPFIIDKVDAAIDSAYTLQMGVTISMFPSASGRLFMAYLPRSRWEHLLPREPAVKKNALEAILQEVRQLQMAIVDPTTLPGYSVLAAPVFDRHGKIAAALCVIGPIGRFDKSYDGRPATGLREIARRTSELLGHAS